MGSRMDKYNNSSDIPKRSDKNKELYRQIYNAYDEFENLVVPSNVKEIDLHNQNLSNIRLKAKKSDLKVALSFWTRVSGIFHKA